MSHAVEEKEVDDDDQVSQDESGNTDSKRYNELMNQGQNLYASLHLLFYTGFFRLLPSKDFAYELFSGYSIELCLSILPMFFCQVFNNANSDSLTLLQSLAMIMKIASLLILMIELAMLVWEMQFNKKMRKLGQSEYNKLPEEERRRKWSKKMTFLAVFSMTVFLAFLIGGVFVSPGRECAKR